MDETALNPRQLPDRTYLADDEDPKDTRGDKSQNDKVRVTMVCCVSAVGEKIDILIIGKLRDHIPFMLKVVKQTTHCQSHIQINKMHGWIRKFINTG